MKNNSELVSGIILDESHKSLISQAAQDEIRFSAFVENAIEGIWRIDFVPPINLDAPRSQQNDEIFENGMFTAANNAAADIYGLPRVDDLIGRPLREFMEQSDPKNREKMNEFVQNRFLMKNLLTYEKNTRGDTRCIVNNISPCIQDNHVHYVWGASLDITELLDLQEELDSSRKELAVQKKALEEKNAALKELITHIELDKKDFKERVIANIDQVILPSLDKIKLNEGNVAQIGQLRRDLEDLTSSFGIKVTERKVNLTPREIEICNLVKNGLSSKEISRMLKIALHTVEKHRRTARKKLGLTSKGINLQTHLNTF
jgi:PAS domain S-box-containing protein